MKLLIAIIMVALSPLQSFSQTAADSVKQTINNLFLAMKTADTVLLRSVFANEAVLQTIQLHKITGMPSVKNEKVANFIRSVANIKPGAADEQITFKSIIIDADLASVWTPYRFYYNQQFSHCGVNSFQLVRLDGIWKIQYLIDTRRKSDCNK